MRRKFVLLLSAFLLASSLDLSAGGPSPSSNLKDEDVPEWFRDSQRLSSLLGGKAVGEVKDAKVIRRVPTPISDLDALVIEGMVTPPEGGEPKKDVFVIYVDKGGRYLVAGLIVDMKDGVNVGRVIERSVLGEVADRPEVALNPMEMHGVDFIHANIRDDSTVVVVIDLGPDGGKKNLLAIHRVITDLARSGKKTARLRIVPVSSAQDEWSVGAMAIALGYETLHQGDGYEKLVEFAKDGQKASWLDKKRLSTDQHLKSKVGLGVFKLDENSKMALLARVKTLPLVYRVKDGKLESIPVPTTQKGWEELLSSP